MPLITHWVPLIELSTKSHSIVQNPIIYMYLINNVIVLLVECQQLQVHISIHDGPSLFERLSPTKFHRSYLSHICIHI